MAVVASRPDADRFGLLIDEIGNGTHPLAGDIPVEGGLASVEIDEVGRIEVVRHTMTGERIASWVAPDGSLQAQPDK